MSDATWRVIEGDCVQAIVGVEAVPEYVDVARARIVDDAPLLNREAVDV